MCDQAGILLKGLDGSNPLAFLAALGTLRTLSLALPNEPVRMSWTEHEGAWRPRVWCSLANSGDGLLATCEKSLVRERSSHPTRFLDYASQNAQAKDFFEAVRRGTIPSDDFDCWVAALTNDVHPEATSPLQLTRSDYFSGNIDQILANTTRAHLGRALFDVWRYDDVLDNQSLHLDPSEDRRHAYQWNKPSGDPSRKKSGNMLGANRLALEALPMFLGVPSNNPKRLHVTGWTGVRSDDATWTWPIWSVPVGTNVVQSLMGLTELQMPTPNSGRLKAVGVSAVFRCRRILVEKTPNLTPTMAIVSVSPVCAIAALG
jgi:CRISPR-associated endonuclease/helicase Cas3